MNGKTKERTKAEKIAEVDKALEKVKEVLKKYGDPFEGKSTMDVLKILRAS